MAENQSLEWLGLGLTGCVTLLHDSESGFLSCQELQAAPAAWGRGEVSLRAQCRPQHTLSVP